MRQMLATLVILFTSYGIARYFDQLDELDELRAKLAEALGDRRLADNAAAAADPIGALVDGALA